MHVVHYEYGEDKPADRPRQRTVTAERLRDGRSGRRGVSRVPRRRRECRQGRYGRRYWHALAAPDVVAVICGRRDSERSGPGINPGPAQVVTVLERLAYWQNYYDLGGPLVPGGWTIVTSGLAILGTVVNLFKPVLSALASRKIHEMAIRSGGWRKGLGIFRRN